MKELEDKILFNLLNGGDLTEYLTLLGPKLIGSIRDTLSVIAQNAQVHISPEIRSGLRQRFGRVRL